MKNLKLYSALQHLQIFKSSNFQIIFSFLIFNFSFLISSATSYTWNGSTSTAWNTAANWTPSVVPTSTDVVTIVTTSNHPQLSANTIIAGLTLTSGTLDLNTYSLTVNGNATFNGGTLAGSTGTLIIRGGTSTFAGTSINPSVDVIVNTLLFNGSTFNGKGYFETTTNVPGTSSGGCTFNDSITIKRSYTGSGIMYLANSNPNTYNGAVAIINNGTKEIQVCNAGTSYFYENLTLENTSLGGIWFGSTTGGGANLDSEKEILVGATGFSAGTLLLRNVTTSNTSWGITLTGTAILNCISSSFADVNTGFTAPSILLKDNLFFGITTIEQNGSVNASWSGGNTFYDNAFINNSGAGILRLDIDNGNSFQNNLTLYANTHEIKLTNAGETTIGGNLNAQTAYVNFISGIGTLTFGGANQTAAVNSALKNVKINSQGGNLTLSTPATIIGLLTFVNGNITSTSTNLLTLNSTASVTGASNSSFVSGPIKKIGNTAFSFPTGKGSRYSAIEITAPTSSTDAFTGEYFDAAQSLGTNKDTSLLHINQCDYWVLNRNNGTSNVNVSLHWNENSCFITYPQNMRVAGWNGTKWTDMGSASYSGSNFGSLRSSSTSGSIVNYALANTSTSFVGLPTTTYLKDFAVLSANNLFCNTVIRATGKTGSQKSVINFISTDSLLENNVGSVPFALNEFYSSMMYYAGLGSTINLNSNLSDTIISPGIYKIQGNLFLSNKIRLQGDSASVFIFIVEDSLIFNQSSLINFDNLRMSNIIWYSGKGILIKEDAQIAGVFLTNSGIKVENMIWGYCQMISQEEIIISNNSPANSKDLLFSLTNLQNNVYSILPCTSTIACNLIRNPGFEDGAIATVGGSFNANTVFCWRRGGSVGGTVNCNGSNGNTPDIHDSRITGSFLNCSNSSSYFPDPSIPFGSISNNIPTGGSVKASGTFNFRYASLHPIEVISADLNVGLSPQVYLFTFYVQPSSCNGSNFINDVQLCVGFSGPQGSVNGGVFSLSNMNANSWRRYDVCLDLTGFSQSILAACSEIQLKAISLNNTVGRFHIDDVSLIHIADAGPVKNITCGSVSIGNTCPPDPLNYSISYYWTFSNGNPIQNGELSSTTVANPICYVPGSYLLNVDILDQNGNSLCSDYDYVDVTGTGGSQLTVSITPSVQTICQNQSGSLSTTISGGTSPYSYQWYLNGNILNGITSQTHTPSLAGSYSVVVIDANGCTGSATATVAVQQVNITNVPTHVTCFGLSNGSAEVTSPTGAGVTYLWSNGVTTALNANITAATYTVTVTSNGCTATSTVTITQPSNINVSLTPAHATCATSNGGIVSTVTGGVLNYTYAWSNSAITADLTNIGAGTYTLTVTDVNGCTKNQSTTISTSGTPPVAPIVTGTIPACQAGNNYSVQNVNANYTYSWTASSGQTSTSGVNSPTASNLTWQPYNGNTITFTATYNGCSTSTQFQVFPCCTATTVVGAGSLDISGLSTSDLIANPTLYDPYYNTNQINMTWGNCPPIGPCIVPPNPYTAGGSTNSTLIINGTFTVDEDLLLTTCEVVLGPNARIDVVAGKELRLEGCWLHSCNEALRYMWDGIYATDNSTPSNPAHTKVWSGSGYNTSYFEDAENGIVANGNVMVGLPFSNFNKNFKSIQIKNYSSGIQPSYCFGMTFSCVGNIFSANPFIPSNALLPPHYNERSYSAFEIDNVNQIDIQNSNGLASSQSARFLMFNLENGILAHNSNVNVRSVTFDNITSSSASLGTPSYLGFPITPRGLAIGIMNSRTTAPITNYNLGVGTSYTIAGATVDPANIFINCSMGIYTQARVASQIERNSFTGIKTGTPIYQRNPTAIYIRGGFASDVTIDANVFFDFKYGVYVENRNSGSNIDISNNQFNQSGSGIGYYPISVQSPLIPTSPSSIVTIESNSIRRIQQTGITLINQQNALVRDNNPMEFNITTLPSQSRLRGIHVIGGSNNTISENRIDKTGSNPTSTHDNTLTGINIQSSTGNIVASNHVIKLGTGIRYILSTLQQTLQCNNMDQNRIGLKLESSNIGIQGSAAVAQDNEWNDFVGFDKDVRGSGTLYQHTFFAQQITPPFLPFILDITPTFIFGTTPYFNFPTGIASTTCNAPLINPQQHLIAIINEQGDFANATSDEKYLSKQAVFYQLALYDTLMQFGTIEDTLLLNFFDSTRTTALGLFHRVEILLDSGLFEQAIELNNSITTTNAIEETTKDVLSIYAATWAQDIFELSAEQIATLEAIAYSSPISFGNGVYGARVMLGLDIDDMIEEGGLRITPAPKPDNPNFINLEKFKIYPNPTNNILNLEIELKENETFQFILSDLTGRVLIGLNIIKNHTQIELAKLESGIYTYSLRKNQGYEKIGKISLIK